MLISVVSTVYQAEDIIDALVREVIENVSKVTDDFEIVLIEDGSPDNSWKAIQQNCKKDKRVKGIKLTRNFGSHHAALSGLAHAQGEKFIIMGADLQDPPELIP
ncbi:MAG: glycosyltransferase, partial [Candidatus Melainabacteria bacterium]|nr:glycosyltransferase [Candidatus Melainabacteria bacterium]